MAGPVIRTLAQWYFSGGAEVKAWCMGDVTDEAALDMLEELIKIKRDELARNRAKKSEARHDDKADALTPPGGNERAERD